MTEDYRQEFDAWFKLQACTQEELPSLFEAFQAGRASIHAPEVTEEIEPIISSVLDDHSAWISTPNRTVATAIAVALTNRLYSVRSSSRQMTSAYQEYRELVHVEKRTEENAFYSGWLAALQAALGRGK